MEFNIEEIKKKINEWKNREWRWKGKGKIEIKFICLIERAESFKELVDNLELIIYEYEKIEQLLEDEDMKEIAKLNLFCGKNIYEGMLKDILSSCKFISLTVSFDENVAYVKYIERGKEEVMYLNGKSAYKALQILKNRYEEILKKQIAIIEEAIPLTVEV
ncbi:hypothetical protein [Methanocaldococcus fervens]|uniref:Uncharacterized protein n=1 Tax=Methanocaldococcus fervens (strain DSM 4213 / JCM 15782 / AG86) TaxID=573064 RepID=C7P8W6_METFA|nr:hypothetical protein [Methanocaldococcus fervens]ACV24998.1 hypothetical protein Mefer_1189 [Methanocaldococcus fervens AG86]